MTQDKKQHTPAPWIYEYDHLHGDASVEIGDRRFVVQIDAINGGTEDEQIANARLIAAAPEMLEALEGMLEWARRVKGKPPEGLEVFNAINAIARAMGGE
jgi:hypothetical protein